MVRRFQRYKILLICFSFQTILSSPSFHPFRIAKGEPVSPFKRLKKDKHLPGFGNVSGAVFYRFITTFLPSFPNVR